jgi:hypothetical protein
MPQAQIALFSPVIVQCVTLGQAPGVHFFEHCAIIGLTVNARIARSTSALMKSPFFMWFLLLGCNSRGFDFWIDFKWSTLMVRLSPEKFVIK